MFCPNCLKINLQFDIICIERNCYVCLNVSCDLSLTEKQYRNLVNSISDERVKEKESRNFPLTEMKRNYLMESFSADNVNGTNKDNNTAKLIFCPNCLRINLQFKIIRIGPYCFVCSNESCNLSLTGLEYRDLIKSLSAEREKENDTNEDNNHEFAIVSEMELSKKTSNEKLSPKLRRPEKEKEAQAGDQINTPAENLQVSKTHQRISTALNHQVKKKHATKKKVDSDSHNKSINYLAVGPSQLPTEWRILSMLLLHLEIFDLSQPNPELAEAHLVHVLCTTLIDRLHIDAVSCLSRFLKLKLEQIFIREQKSISTVISVNEINNQSLANRFCCAIDRYVDQKILNRNTVRISTKIFCKKCNHSKTTTTEAHGNRVPIPFQKTYFSINLNRIRYQARCTCCQAMARFDVTIEGDHRTVSPFLILSCKDGVKDRLDRYDKPLSTVSNTAPASHSSRYLSLVAVLEMVENGDDVGAEEENRQNQCVDDRLIAFDTQSDGRETNNNDWDGKRNAGRVSTNPTNDWRNLVGRAIGLESSDRYLVHIRDKSGWITMDERFPEVCQRVKMLKIEKTSNIRFFIYGQLRLEKKNNFDNALDNFIKDFEQKTGIDLVTMEKVVKDRKEKELTKEFVTGIRCRNLSTTIENVDLEKLTERGNFSQSPKKRNCDKNSFCSSQSDLFSVISFDVSDDNEEVPAQKTIRTTNPSLHSWSTLSRVTDNETTGDSYDFSELCPWLTRRVETNGFPSSEFSVERSSTSLSQKNCAPSPRLPYSSSGVSSTCSSLFSQAFRRGGAGSSSSSVINSNTSTLRQPINNCLGNVNKGKRDSDCSDFSIEHLITQKRLKLSQKIYS